MKFLLVPVLACLLITAGCKGRGMAGGERYYVIAPQATLRDRVAALYNKTGTVQNGDQVELLEKSKRWARVRNARGEEGWILEQYLVDQSVYNAFQQLHKDSLAKPAQAHAVLRDDFRLHLSPSRDADKLFLIKEGSKLELLERATAPKNPPPKPAVTKKEPEEGNEEIKGEEQESSVANQAVKPPAKAAKAKPAGKGKPGKTKPSVETEVPPPQMEDWWLVRDNQQHAGWVLGRALDVDVPLEVAQYAEGQRIVATYVLTQVVDPEADRPDKNVPYYLMLLTPPHDGLPFDYDQVRIFSWNVKRHRYETAYRERNIFGLLPVTVDKEDFGKEGVLPAFTLHVKDDAGNTVERKYKMNGVIVKRVLGPAEEAAQNTAKRAAHQRSR